MKKTAISLILALAMVLSFVLVAAPAAEAAGHTTHCVCGGKAAGIGDHTACADLTGEWIDLNTYVQTSTALQAGNYYLSADLQLTTQLKPADAGMEITICLNGHEIKGSTNKDEADSKVMFLNAAGTVNICDCSANNTGKMSSISIKQGSVILVQGNADSVLNVYSGTLVGSPNCTAAGGNLRVKSGGTINLYKAVLKDGKHVGTASSFAGNLMIDNSTVNMYGGSILNGSANNNGGNVYVHNSTFNIYGGTISGGTAQLGANIYGAKGTIKVVNLDATTTMSLSADITLDVSQMDSSITKTQSLGDYTFTKAAPSTPSTPSNPSKPNNPATGDSANLVVMGLGLVLGVAGIACLLPKKQEI